MKFLLLIIMLACSGCLEGPTGPQGDQGPAGQDAPEDQSTAIVYTGTLTPDMLSDTGGSWTITTEGRTEGILSVNAFVGNDGIWLRSPLWGYAIGGGQIVFVISNTELLEAGYEYRIIVFYK